MKAIAKAFIYLFVLSMMLSAALFAPFPTVTASTIEATVSFDPDKINLDTPPPSPTVIAVIEFPKSSGQDVKDIDPSTILIDGVIPLVSCTLETKKLKTFFDKQTVVNYLWTKVYHMGYVEPFKNLQVELTLAGSLYDGTPFQGTDTVYVSAK